MWRNPLEAGQKFNSKFFDSNVYVQFSRNPLEAGQKFNETNMNFVNLTPQSQSP